MHKRNWQFIKVLTCLTCLVILLNKLKLYIPLESASGIPILKLLNGKTSAYNSSFLFHKSFEDLWMKSYQFIKICRLKIESIWVGISWCIQPTNNRPILVLQYNQFSNLLPQALSKPMCKTFMPPPLKTKPTFGLFCFVKTRSNN
jgi:hypothetical protein